MALKLDLVTVKVSVNGKEQTIKMERGTSFENKGGIFTAGENNGVLKMTNYQLQAFKAMANNYAEEGEEGIVLSKKDIQEAQNKYKQGGFVTDMSEFLPESYKIEKPKLTSSENMVQAYVTNGKESQSATLKFSYKSDIELNTDNQVIEQVPAQPSKNSETKEEAPKVSEVFVGADSVLVEKYAKEFKGMNPKMIANKLLNQIKGCSNNTETLSMFDAITDEKLIDVIKAYNGITSEYKEAWDYNAADTHAEFRDYHTYAKTERNLVDALNNELGITIKELYPRIQRLTSLLKEAYPDKDNEISKINKLAKPSLGVLDFVSYSRPTINAIEYNFQSILETSESYGFFEEAEYDKNWYGIGYHRHNEHHYDGNPFRDGYTRTLFETLMTHSGFGLYW